jgi:hypothetical protein
MLAAVVVWLIAMTGASAQNIWFDPHSGKGGSVDYMDLFRPEAPWRKAAAAISTFEISDELTYKHEISDDQLSQIFKDLEWRGLDLLVGISPLIGGERDGLCGYHVEGYSLRNGLLHEARRIKSLGGEVKYFGLDEPLYFGHVFESKGSYFGCHLTVGQVAEQVADQLRAVRTVFPNARFGDVEPLMGFRDESWLAELALWFDAYEAAAGDRLAFFRLDLGWDRQWQSRIGPLTQLLKAKNVPLQVIYNGDDRLKSDEEWINSAVAHFQEYESGGRSPPDAAVFQYWGIHPTRLLPESDRRVATWLINKYVEWHSDHKIYKATNDR